MRLKKITKRWVEKHGACEAERFLRLFPDGLDLNDARQVKRAWRLMNAGELGWFLRQIGAFTPCPTCRDGRDNNNGRNCPAGLPAKRQLRPFAIKAGLLI